MSELYMPVPVEPTTSTLIIGGIAREVFVVTICGEDYDQCEMSSHNMWANAKTGEFGRGLVNEEGDERLVERTGRLGEIAVCKVFHSSPDLSYLKHGDKRDLTLLTNIAVDVKTSRDNRYKAGLIRAVTDTGRELPLLHDLYLFGFVAQEDRNAKTASIVIVGGNTKKRISQYPRVPAKKGSHLNYEIPYARMILVPKIYNSWKGYVERRRIIGR